tara:strand:- start:1257 stop:1616 length:360 start_codon:yes stop_codon:yes gene_type:complete
MSWEEVLKRNQELEEVAVKLKKALEKHHDALLKITNDDDLYFEIEQKYSLDDIYVLDDEGLREAMKKQFDSFMEEFNDIVENTSDTFEKEAGGVSFGGHGTNPELFNISYGKKKRKKDD